VLEWFESSGGQEAALASFSTTKLPYLEGFAAPENARVTETEMMTFFS
jgi:hypothetical protein